MDSTDAALGTLARQHLATCALTPLQRRWLLQAIAHWEATGVLTALERGAVRWVAELWAVEIGEI